MKKFIVFILVVLPVHAGSLALNTSAEQRHETLCTQQRLKACINKCHTSNDATNCAQLCQENAKNECRQAGE